MMIPTIQVHSLIRYEAREALGEGVMVEDDRGAGESKRREERGEILLIKVSF